MIPDHPRSRGVYSKYRTSIPGGMGSSPLARGLPGRGDIRAVKPRIIPARAGFTFLLLSRAKSTMDHPRSRGVYRRIPTQGIGQRGSSPLARGLRNNALTDPRVIRIIPARAGFTEGVAQPLCSQTDHPRSRGVYSTSAGR